MNDVVDSLLTPDAIAEYAKSLDPAGNSEAVEPLSRLDAAAVVGEKIVNDEMADCCLSGLWLLYNHLHRSHDISQSIETAEGSWWHAIMHRTEGDFSNSKYWYRRVGEHELFAEIEADFDPYAFVDRCQQEYRSGELSQTTQQIAFAEWQALFRYCQQNSV